MRTTSAIAAFITLVLALLATTSSGRETSGDYVIEPEYERTLQKVVLSLETTTEDLTEHKSILENLPYYTDIIILAPEDKEKMIRREMSKFGASHEVRIIPFQTQELMMEDAYVLSTETHRIRRLDQKVTIPRGTVWAQDLFEVAQGADSGTLALTPFVHKWVIQSITGNESQLMMDNQFVSNLQAEGISHLSTPIIFKGGNVLVDHRDGKRIALVGRDIINETILVFHETLNQYISEEDVVRNIREHLKVDRVIVVGSHDHQPLKMFHLDQAMVLLGDGVAGVTRVVGRTKDSGNEYLEDIQRFLAELRSDLKRLGYRIVDIEATVDDIFNYRFYVNDIAYRNRNTGKKEFLFPMFDTSLEGMNRKVYLNNIRRLESLEYRVIQVPTESNHRHGGLHCMVNVVS